MIVERVMVVIIALIGIVATIACGYFIKENKRCRDSIMLLNLTVENIKRDMNRGIERTATVYDINGEIIEQYKGDLGISYNGECIRLGDKNGKNHMIFYTTGTVIIDEEIKIK